MMQQFEILVCQQFAWYLNAMKSPIPVDAGAVVQRYFIISGQPTPSSIITHNTFFDYDRPVI